MLGLVSLSVHQSPYRRTDPHAVVGGVASSPHRQHPYANYRCTVHHRRGQPISPRSRPSSRGAHSCSPDHPRLCEQHPVDHRDVHAGTAFGPRSEDLTDGRSDPLLHLLAEAPLYAVHPLQTGIPHTRGGGRHGSEHHLLGDHFPLLPQGRRNQPYQVGDYIHLHLDLPRIRVHSGARHVQNGIQHSRTRFELLLTRLRRR